MSKPPVALVRDPIQIAEQDGPWMSAQEIATELYNGKVKARWVRDNVPGKHVFGHSTVLWRRNKVLRWMASREEREKAS